MAVVLSHLCSCTILTEACQREMPEDFEPSLRSTGGGSNADFGSSDMSLMTVNERRRSWGASWMSSGFW